MVLFRGLEVFFVAMFWFEAGGETVVFAAVARMLEFGFCRESFAHGYSPGGLFFSRPSIICVLLFCNVAVQGWSTDSSFLSDAGPLRDLLYWDVFARGRRLDDSFFSKASQIWLQPQGPKLAEHTHQ